MGNRRGAASQTSSSPTEINVNIASDMDMVLSRREFIVSRDNTCTTNEASSEPPPQSAQCLTQQRHRGIQLPNVVLELLHLGLLIQRELSIQVEI